MNWRRFFDESFQITLNNCLNYNNVEICILDYGSTDGVGEWIRDNFSQHIKSGLVNFYKVDEDIKYFHITRAKNISHRLASGDFIINFDGDNFIHDPSYISLVQNLLIPYEKNKKAVLIHGKTRLRGKIGFFKTDFDNVLRGYDEKMNNYSGVNDRDIFRRAVNLKFSVLDMSRRWLTRKNSCTIKDDSYSTINLENKGNFNNLYRKYSQKNINEGELFNKDIKWGSARVIKNFSEIIEI